MPLDLSKAFNLMPSTLMPLTSPVPKRRATVSCKPDSNASLQETASFMNSIASRLASSDRNNNSDAVDEGNASSVDSSQRHGSLTPSDGSMHENDDGSINVDSVDSTVVDEIEPRRAPVTVISSPIHLPKSESPDYDKLVSPLRWEPVNSRMFSWAKAMANR